MRVRIIFSLTNKGASVPFQHQSLVYDLIKSLVLKTKFENYILYTFSGLKGRIKIDTEGLQFHSDKVTLIIASKSEEFLQSFLKALFKLEQIVLGNLVLIPLKVEKELPVVLANEVKYVCISPLVILDPYTTEEPKQFIDPGQDAFSDILYENTMNRIESSEAFSPEQIMDFHKFQLIPDKLYLQKIGQEGKKFSRIFSILDKGRMMEARGYTFPFTLYAAPEVQQFIYDCGLGAISNYGSGMLDFVNTDFNLRTVEYNFDS